MQRTPDSVALLNSSGGPAWTYYELNCKANQLSHYLRKRGLKAGGNIGVCLPRSAEAMAAIVAILKLGCSYVPLDANYPRKRLQSMADDAQIVALIIQEELGNKAPGTNYLVISLDGLREEISAQPVEDPKRDPSRSAVEAAYVMYTSGSTGKPKGVTVRHRGIVRLVLGTDYINFGSDQTFLQLAPLSFDASTFEIWGALLHGAKLVVMPDGVPSMQELGRTLRDCHVTTLWLTGTFFNAVVNEAPTILDWCPAACSWWGSNLRRTHSKSVAAASGYSDIQWLWPY